MPNHRLERSSPDHLRPGNLSLPDTVYRLLRFGRPDIRIHIRKNVVVRRQSSRLLWIALFASMWTIAVLVPWSSLPHLECPIKSILGIPCPTCGGTRAIIALKSLDLPGALSFNPLITLGMLISGIWALLLFIPNIPTPDHIKSWVRVILISGLVAMMIIQVT